MSFCAASCPTSRAAPSSGSWPEATSASMARRSNRPITRARAKPSSSSGPGRAPLRRKRRICRWTFFTRTQDLLVVNKPAGMVVHPAAGHREHTLVNALLHHCAGQLSGIGGVARPGIVHRLDKETSGCLVAAKNDAAHLDLSAQFAGREVEKIYQAVACGRMPRLGGRIDAAIARDPANRKRMAVNVRNGREARTSYRVRERWAEATLVEVELAHRADASNPRAFAASWIPGGGRPGLWPARHGASGGIHRLQRAAACCCTPGG